MVLLGRGGVPRPLAVPPGGYQRYDLSADRRWLAIVAPGPEHQELRLYDLRDNQVSILLTAEYVRQPLWSPTGAELVFAVRDSTRWSVLRLAPHSGRAPDTLFTTTNPQDYWDPVDWRLPGQLIIQDWVGAVVAQVGAGEPFERKQVLIGSDARFGSVSPGGHLLAYQTVEGSRVIVTTFPQAGKRWQVASQGVEPIWLSATELLYRAGVSWYLARLDPATGEPAGAPVYWGRDPRFSDTSGWSNRPTSDGGILYLQTPDETSARYLRVIPDWVRRARAAMDSAHG